MNRSGCYRAMLKMLLGYAMVCICVPAAATSTLSGSATTASVIQRYDPLRLPAAGIAAPIDLDVHDDPRQRDIPIRVYLPDGSGTTSAPVVLFSHGLGGSREGSAFLGKHWAARGYAVVYLQHPGSDESVWRDAARAERLRALRDAANLSNFALRVADVPAVLDQLTTWSQTAGHPLYKRLDLGRIAMSGHSFGAVTAQAVSGERLPLSGTRYTDRRIRAAILMSPSSPRSGSVKDAFATVHLPWLLMTGTKDVSPIGNQDVASRLVVYDALPAGDKYEVVLDEAEHSVFTDRPLPNERTPRNPKHHTEILALTTAFLDAYIMGSDEARAWLQGAEGRAALAAADRWEKK